MPLHKSSRLWALSLLLAWIATATPALGQVLDIRMLRDLPLDAELETFKKRVMDQPLPPDSTTLFQEIKNIQAQQKLVSDLARGPRESSRAREHSNHLFATQLVIDGPDFCSETDSATAVRTWWDDQLSQIRGFTQQVSERIGAPYEILQASTPTVEPADQCQSYRKKLEGPRAALLKVVNDVLGAYARVEEEKLGNIGDVSAAYDARLVQLNEQLEMVRKQSEERRATSIAENLWVIFAVLGGIAMGILLIVRAFPQSTQLELVQSGQVIQFITVLLLLTVIMALGLSSVIQENTLGTLLGGLAGYVLSQGVGRAAGHVAMKTKGVGSSANDATQPEDQISERGSTTARPTPRV